MRCGPGRAHEKYANSSILQQPSWPLPWLSMAAPPGPVHMATTNQCLVSAEYLGVLMHAAFYITEWHSFIRAAPPVPEGSSKCKTQQIHRPHVSCSPDGNYTSVQCCGGPRARCHCVDPLTGIQLVGAHSVPEREKDTLDCSDGNIRGEPYIAYVRSTVLCKPHPAQNTNAFH